MDRRQTVAHCWAVNCRNDRHVCELRNDRNALHPFISLYNIMNGKYLRISQINF